MAHIEIQGVAKSFGALHVLQDCTLSVDKGTVLTLLGPSGCGKTTLLRVLAGFAEPDAGRVHVGGVDITDTAPSRRQVGFVFQNYALFPHLTVAGNVAYGLKVRRVGRAAIRERVSRALDLVSLAGLDDRYPAQLSGGQQQRVAITRALVLEPQVLLLDEPFNALDLKLRQAMQIELRKLIGRVGITSIFVTHDQGEAMTLSDTVAVMRAGRIEQLGRPLEIYDRPATEFVATFIGRANVLPARAHGGIIEGMPDLDARGNEGEVALVVRPENLALADGAGPGWSGRVAFASAIGPTVEYEIDIGAAEPLRVAAQRRAGETLLAAGATMHATIIEPSACIVLPR